MQSEVPSVFRLQDRGTCYLFFSLLSVDPVFPTLDEGGVAEGREYGRLQLLQLSPLVSALKSRSL